MKSANEAKISGIFLVCGLLLLAALCGGVYLQYLNDLAENGRNLSTRRLLALEETLTSLQEVRINQGSLLITGKPVYFDQFNGSRVELERQLAGLETLYSGDEHSARVITELKRLCALKVHELLGAVEQQRTSGFETARALFLSRTSDDYGLAIRMLIDHLKQQDHETNAASSRLIARQHSELFAAAAGVFVLAISCGGLAHASLRREMRRRHDLTLRLEHEASHDALTGLANRRSFMQELERAVARVARSGGLLAILFIDLDGFKRINDELGHDAGDQLLRQVAREFENGVRRSETVARLGGDEFAVIAQADAYEAFEQLGRRLIQIASQPLLGEHRDHCISASVGIAAFPVDAADSASLLTEADAAMYQAKRHGKGRVARPRVAAVPRPDVLSAFAVPAESC